MKKSVWMVLENALDEAAPGGQRLFSLETPGKSFVVMAARREEAIVFLSGIVGKQYITQHRDQVQQHLGPVVQVDHSTDDVEEPEHSDAQELDIDNMKPMESAGGRRTSPKKPPPKECPLCGEEMPCEEHLEQNRDHGVSEGRRIGRRGRARR